LAALHREGEVLSMTEGEDAMTVHIRLPNSAMGQFVPFLTGGAGTGTGEDRTGTGEDSP
jgi:hypothetical protein